MNSARIWQDDFKSRFWTKKYTTCQILKEKKEQRVRIWFKSPTTRQVLDWKNNNALDFELKIFQHFRVRKNVCNQKITFCFLLHRKNDIFCIFCAFLKSMILYWKFHYVSDFELKKIQRVRFWIWKITTRQISNWNKYKALYFELNFFRHVRFWKNVCIQKNPVLFCEQFTPWTQHILHFSCIFKKHDFELKISLRVRFWIEKNTTRQILKNNKILKSMILKKKLFLKSTIS